MVFLSTCSLNLMCHILILENLKNVLSPCPLRAKWRCPCKRPLLIPLYSLYQESLTVLSSSIVGTGMVGVGDLREQWCRFPGHVIVLLLEIRCKTQSLSHGPMLQCSSIFGNVGHCGCLQRLKEQLGSTGGGYKQGGGPIGEELSL